MSLSGLQSVRPGPQSPSANSGVILLTPRSEDSAASVCAALGEQLWSPESSTAGIQTSLDYLTFQKKFTKDQQYWIAPTTSDAQAIDGRGQISSTATFSKHIELPALCTQSAPFSNQSYQDTSSKWQVTVHSNNEYITGYVPIIRRILDLYATTVLTSVQISRPSKLPILGHSICSPAKAIHIFDTIQRERK